jgi:protein-S-isoprenylcysteine O-methyltransferase Ste14
MIDPAERPNRLPWPPMIYVGAVLAGVALQVVWPVGLPEWLRPVGALLGLAVMAVGVMIDVLAIRTLARAGTTVMPHQASARLVTTGPYALSRNPIYLGNTLALSGLALIFEVPWFVPMAFLAALLVQELAIKREERHLAAKFGADWTAYAARVRRWI